MRRKTGAFISGLIVLLLAVSNVAHVSGQSVLALIVPPPYNVVKGDNFSIVVRLEDILSLQEYQFTVSWETEYFEYVGGAVTPPAAWTTAGPSIVYPAPNRTGVMFGAIGFEAVYVGGAWNVATITLKALKTGSTWIRIDNVSIRPTPMWGILTQDGLVTIVDPPPPPPKHDIAIVDVTPSPTVVGFGITVYIGVTVENQGNFSETFNVTAYVNGEDVQTKSSTLAAGASKQVYLTWSTAESGPGNYTIGAYAWPVADESETEDNTFTDGSVLVIVICDVNDDGKVNMLDLYLISLRYGAKLGEPRYDPTCDVNDDANINMLDLWLGALNFGRL